MNLPLALRRAPLFSGLDAENINYFASHGHVKNYTKGSDLFAMGDRAEAFFFILDGWIKLYRMTREGEEVIINVFAPGETFAEAAVFSPLQRYPVNAQAVEDTTVLEIPRQLFVDKIRENSDLALMMLGSISARQRLLVQQIEQLTAKNAPQRIGTFLLRLCPAQQKKNVIVNLPYDKSLIARRLNIQPETFSRALTQLKPHGVSMAKRQITIKDTDHLADFCDLDDRDRPY
jgi:CRP/FNR family transcriptional regulator, dissimilatory nitrate respiration regulator